MLLVVLLALGSSTAAAVSTVLKVRSANAERVPAWAQRLPRAVASIVANRLFATAMAFDSLAVGLQVLALDVGGLAVVQPMLSAALVISLGLQHAVDRIPVSKTEALYAVVLVAGLVTFLTVSGATSPAGQDSIGRRWPGVALAVLATAAVGVSVLATRRASAHAQARVLAFAVAAVYATTAGLMKSVTHILSLRGVLPLLLSWQLWTLVVVAAVGLVLGQHAFAIAPLRVSLPVIGSLDPLFSVLIGLVVYGETLRSTPGAVAGEVLGLAALLLGVVRLSTTSHGQPQTTT